MKILIFANSVHTDTLSGGDKIFVECAKRWMRWGHDVGIITNEAGKGFCEGAGISSHRIVLWWSSWLDGLGFVPANISKTLTSVLYSLFYRFPRCDVVFASSFFLPDMLPTFIVKLHQPRVKVVTASYIFTREPWGRDYSGGKWKGFLFYINEVISLRIAQMCGSKVLTASPFDRTRFVDQTRFGEGDVLAVGGGVDNDFFRSVPKQSIKYDAVFVGRFHPQKCVSELIDIWSKIVAWDKKRVLALVGGGILESELKEKVRRVHLERNILFLGVQDGVDKAMILKSSKIFVSASRFDTGNIALDEGMACGLPGILYDTPHLTYDKGVVRVPLGDGGQFAKEIIALLSDGKRRKQVSRDALAYAKSIDWDVKAKRMLELIAA